MTTTEEKPLVAKSLPELIVDDGEFQAMRQRLVHEKMAIQAQLVEVNSKLSGKILPNNKYHSLMAHRSNIIHSLMQKETELSDLNAARREVLTVIEVRKRNEFSVTQVKELVDLRDRWHEYSMEPSNHQKAREAAFKFSQELRAILKPYFDSAPG